MNITRSALVLFSPWTSEQSAMIFIGKNRNGCLTTIGGRKERKEGSDKPETETECLIREVYEETKGVIDYRVHPNLLFLATIRKYKNCQYYFIETTLQNLLMNQREFNQATSDREVCNELSSLEIMSIEDLAEDFIVDKTIPAHPEFVEMFLDVGFDTIARRRTTYFTHNIGARVDLRVPIYSLPKLVSVFPFVRGLPVVYGVVIPNGTYITDQYYFRNERGMLFRTGWVLHSD